MLRKGRFSHPLSLAGAKASRPLETGRSSTPEHGGFRDAQPDTNEL
jgi:hypothetical protein